MRGQVVDEGNLGVGGIGIGDSSMCTRVPIHATLATSYSGYTCAGFEAAFARKHGNAHWHLLFIAEALHLSPDSDTACTC